jgi:hypothetical protein
VLRLRFTSILALVLAAIPCAGRAHEVDQFDVPLGKEFVDLGDYWDRMLYGAVEKAVEKTNESIRRTKKYNRIAPLRQVQLNQLHSPGQLAWSVRRKLPSAILAIEGLELKVHLTGRQPEDSGRITGHFGSLLSGTYCHLPMLPDPRQINRISLLRCSTIKVHGTYFGTDKFSHFVSMGFIYYLYYHAARTLGQSHEEAVATARSIGKNGPISERWLVGYIPSGVYSNADMAANYVGMKYYLNVTEPVRLKGRVYPPMVVREGDFWRIQPHVRPGNGYFSLFVSPHFDEVFNPNLFEWGMRGRVRAAIRARGGKLVDWYAKDDPAKRSPAYFDFMLHECLTYYGEDYGHCGQLGKLITVSQTCFDQQPPKAPGSASPDYSSNCGFGGGGLSWIDLGLARRP